MMTGVVQILRDWAADEGGANLVEYLMLVSLIAVVSVAAVGLLGKAVKAKLDAPRAALLQ